MNEDEFFSQMYDAQQSQGGQSLMPTPDNILSSVPRMSGTTTPVNEDEFFSQMYDAQQQQQPEDFPGFLDKAEGTATAALNSAAFGTADYANAGLNTLIGKGLYPSSYADKSWGQLFDEQLQESRDLEKRFAVQHPNLNMAGSIAGLGAGIYGTGAAGGALIGADIPIVSNALKTAFQIGDKTSTLGKIGKLSAGTAAFGGAEGFGSAEGGFQNRYDAGTRGALIGGLLGTGLGTIGAGLGAVASYPVVANKLAPIANKAKIIGEKLNQDINFGSLINKGKEILGTSRSQRGAIGDLSGFPENAANNIPAQLEKTDVLLSPEVGDLSKSAKDKAVLRIADELARIPESQVQAKIEQALRNPEDLNMVNIVDEKSFGRAGKIINNDIEGVNYAQKLTRAQNEKIPERLKSAMKINPDANETDLIDKGVQGAQDIWSNEIINRQKLTKPFYDKYHEFGDLAPEAGVSEAMLGKQTPQAASDLKELIKAPVYQSLIKDVKRHTELVNATDTDARVLGQVYSRLGDEITDLYGKSQGQTTTKIRALKADQKALGDKINKLTKLPDEKLSEFEKANAEYARISDRVEKAKVAVYSLVKDLKAGNTEVAAAKLFERNPKSIREVKQFFEENGKLAEFEDFVKGHFLKKIKEGKFLDEGTKSANDIISKLGNSELAQEKVLAALGEKEGMAVINAIEKERKLLKNQRALKIGSDTQQNLADASRYEGQISDIVSGGIDIAKQNHVRGISKIAKALRFKRDPEEVKALVDLYLNPNNSLENLKRIQEIAKALRRNREVVQSGLESTRPLLTRSGSILNNE